MMKKLLLLLTIFFIPFVSAVSDKELAERHAVTYKFSGGRFGDNLLAYCQVRYISYITHLPFLFHPFPYSDQMALDFDALPMSAASNYRQIFHVNSASSFSDFLYKIRDPRTSPTLFSFTYFPTDITEWDQDSSYRILYNTPWRDEKFAALIKQCTMPRIPIPSFRKEGYLNVADHVRTLSGADTAETSMVAFPLKHPNVNYHKRQIRRVYEYNLKKPMHVFIFSDTKDPQGLLEDFRNSFTGDDIIFDIQKLQRADVDYVIHDFFAMQKFDVLIATQSNFSMMASRLGDLDMVIFPVHAIGKYPNSQIDRVQVINKPSAWLPYPLNVVLREDLTK